MATSIDPRCVLPFRQVSTQHRSRRPSFRLAVLSFGGHLRCTHRPGGARAMSAFGSLRAIVWDRMEFHGFSFPFPFSLFGPLVGAQGTVTQAAQRRAGQGGRAKRRDRMHGMCLYGMSMRVVISQKDEVICLLLPVGSLAASSRLRRLMAVSMCVGAPSGCTLRCRARLARGEAHG